MRILFRRSKCIGCGVCWDRLPSSWKMDKDGKATLHGSKLLNKDFFVLDDVENEEEQKDISKDCPVKIIKIEK